MYGTKTINGTEHDACAVLLWMSLYRSLMKHNTFSLYRLLGRYVFRAGRVKTEYDVSIYVSLAWLFFSKGGH